MKTFWQFLIQRRRKTTKGAEQSGHQSLEPHNKMRVNDTRVVIGFDGSNLPPAPTPPPMGNADCRPGRFFGGRSLGGACHWQPAQHRVSVSSWARWKSTCGKIGKLGRKQAGNSVQ